MAEIDSTVREMPPLTDTISPSIHQDLGSLQGGPDQELIRRHAAAGVSMFGFDDRYPGELVELAPDGRRFIVHDDGSTFVRVRQVE